MRGTEEHRRIDALLEGAEVLGGEYDDYDPAAARERIARALTAVPPRAQPPSHPDTGWRYRTVHEQAAHDLDLAISLVVGSPGAAESLARLVDHQRTEPEGALVFACLLHLVGHRDAAQFWWQFAAGGGSRTAAFCLCLHHRRLGEFRDADYWRQGRPPCWGAPAAPPAPPGTPPPCPACAASCCPTPSAGTCSASATADGTPGCRPRWRRWSTGCASPRRRRGLRRDPPARAGAAGRTRRAPPPLRRTEAGAVQAVAVKSPGE
ncbi:hypothetical protein LUW77_28405 [Streptomyces radiopugnans]|nr:hypothetical protein LUW77_28405 [Streptomyces radiopugnans]